MENSSSLLELFDALERKLGVELRYEKLDWRMDDQKLFVADIRKATQLIDWRPRVGKEEGIDRTIAWVKSTIAR
jgi:CDP-paratose 2-epimerase